MPFCSSLRLLALVAASTLSASGAVLLSESFDSGSTNLPSGWFTAVASGAGTLLAQDSGSGGIAFAKVNVKSEVQLYSPLLTLQGMYPLHIEFEFNTARFLNSIVLEVSVNGNAYVDFADLGQWLPGHGPSVPLNSANPIADGRSDRMGFVGTGDPVFFSTAAGQILAGPVNTGTTYQFRWRLGAAGAGDPGDAPATTGLIASVLVTTADPPAATPEPAAVWTSGLAIFGLSVAIRRRKTR